MRKFFSFFAALLFAGSMMAQVTITPENSSWTSTAGAQTGTVEGVTVAVTNGVTGSTSAEGATMRIYKDATLTISSASNISKIEFTCTANGTTKYGPGCFAAQDGYSYEGKVGTWIGSATSVSFTASSNQVRATQIVVTLGDAPAVAAPVITGDAVFFDSTIVTMTCSTQDADIYYTTDGTTDPKCDCAAAPEYKKPLVLKATTTIKAAAYTGNDWSAVAEKVFTKAPSFASFEALIAAQLASNTLVEVSFENIKIDSIYVSSQSKKQGLYFTVGETAYEIYYNKAEVPETWEVGGTVSGTIRGNWTVYKGLWEIVPSANDWAWALTYKAAAPIVGVETIYNWAKEAADQVGTTILGGEKVTVDKVKIHENTDDVNGIKFASSYVYADGKWIAIKPTEGGFKAGDVLSVSVVFNNSDVTKYCMADVYAADQTTRLFRSDSASTLNGRNAGEPIVQTYTLEADQDSLLLGRYGNTGMFITLLKVERALVPPTPEHTYTVVGGSAPLFGNTWDPAYEANNMNPITGSEYLYAWKKEGVALTAGKIEYKVCQDHGWDTAWPAQGNYNFTIDEAGLYDVTIFFNPELETPTQVVAEFKGAVVVLPNIILHGNFTGSWADTKAFTPAADSLTASLELALTEGTYEFGFKFDGAWKANGANLTREANTANLSTGEGNMHIAADVPGNYIFTYTYATQDVVVTYPNPIIVPDTIDVTISSLTAPGSLIWDDEVATAGWWQIMGANETCEFSLSNGNTISTAAGTYTVADLDADYSYITVVKANDTIDVAFVDGSITVAVNEAGVVTIVGALLGNDDNVYNFNLTYVDPKAETTVNVTISNGSLIDDYATYGLYGAYGYSDDKTAYVQLGIWAENGFQGNFTEDDLDLKYIGSFVATQAGSIRIFSAAIEVIPGDGNGDYLIKADLLCYNNTLYKVTMTIPAAQGIDAVEAAKKAVKRLVNGMLVIEKAGKTYNANGIVIR